MAVCVFLLPKSYVYFNAEYYATHEIFKLTKEGSGIPEDRLFPVAVLSDEDGIIANGGNEVAMNLKSGVALYTRWLSLL